MERNKSWGNRQTASRCSPNGSSSVECKSLYVIRNQSINGCSLVSVVAAAAAVLVVSVVVAVVAKAINVHLLIMPLSTLSLIHI